VVSLYLLPLGSEKRAASPGSDTDDNDGFALAGGTLRPWGFDLPYRIFVSPSEVDTAPAP
jgi:hypothetical protein